MTAAHSRAEGGYDPSGPLADGAPRAAPDPAGAPAHPGPPPPTRPPARLTPEQLRVFDELLAVGGARPFAPAGLVSELRTRIEAGVAGALERWTERSLWLGKAHIATVLRCEGQLAADASHPRDRSLPASSAIGIVTHRAIQLAHTHPGRTAEEYVRLAIAGSRSEESFADFWDQAPEHVQSDCLVTAVSRLVGFLDAFPPLDPEWTPRFEESIQARVGRLTLSVRPDLILGRPKANGRQSMFIADVKSGELRDFHTDEAQFYALVSTLRFGCPPFRSTVYSLASGDWTAPDVTAETLRAAADRVVEATNRYVDTLTEARPPRLAPGMHCSWCPARDTCQAHAAWDGAGRPEDASGFVVEPQPAATAASAHGAAGNDHRAAAATDSAADASELLQPQPEPVGATEAAEDDPWAL